MLLLGQVLMQLVLIIYEFLLPLNVFEHILRLWQCDVVWKHLRVFVVKVTQLRQTGLGFGVGVGTFEKLVNIIEDQEVFKD